MNEQKKNKQSNEKGKNRLAVIIGAGVVLVGIVVALALLLSKCGRSTDEPAEPTSNGTVLNTHKPSEGEGTPGKTSDAPDHTASPDHTPAPTHVYGKWTVLTEPGCLTAGARERVCTLCGEKQTEELAPLGHDGHNNECVRCGKKAVVADFKLLADKETPDAYMVEKCYATEADVLIPDVYEGKPVVRVRYESFANNEAVRYVSIPDSVEVVESWALAYMPNLEMVRIGRNVNDLDRTFRFWTDSLHWLYVEPGNARYHSYCNCIIETATKTLISGCGGSVLPDDGSVEIINSSSLSNVRNLTQLVIPDSIKEIREFSMNDCYGLLALELPDSVTVIGKNAFEECRGLQSLKLPSGLTALGECWFQGCTSLTEVVLPDTLTDAGVSCFADCTALAKVVLPEGLKRIGNYTFENCTSLENITLPQSLTKLGDAFAGCTSLKKLVIPDGVVDPGVSVVSHCTNLTELVLPKEMTSIPYHFFNNLAALETVVIPAKVTQIDYNAFVNCASLKSVVLPASLNIIQFDIFVNCPSLETVYFTGSAADWAKIRINSSNEVLNSVQIVYDYKG